MNDDPSIRNVGQKQQDSRLPPANFPPSNFVKDAF